METLGIIGKGTWKNRIVNLFCTYKHNSFEFLEIKISNKGVNVKISHHNTFLKKVLQQHGYDMKRFSFLYFYPRNFPRAARGNPLDGSAVGTDFMG